jgi:hypothetical protein
MFFYVAGIPFAHLTGRVKMVQLNKKNDLLFEGNNRFFFLSVILLLLLLALLFLLAQICI